MPKSLTKVIYKPDSQSTDEYIIIINPAEYNKWKDDKSVPLADVVDSFQTFHSGQGAQGILGKPSKQQLENQFGTSKDIDVAEYILKHGTAQAGDGIQSSTFSTNTSRGSAAVDNRGKGLTGI